MKLNPFKFELGQSEVPFLGPIISAVGVARDSPKIRAVMDFSSLKHSQTCTVIISVGKLLSEVR